VPEYISLRAGVLLGDKELLKLKGDKIENKEAV